MRQSSDPEIPHARRTRDTDAHHAATHPPFQLGEWLLNLDVARLAWSLLSDPELIASRGDEAHLTGLVEKRYGLSRREANQAVKTVLHRLRQQPR